MKQKREYLVNRRLFLKQTSIGVAGLAIAGSSLRLLAADNAEFKMPNGFPFFKSNDAFSPVRYRPIATRVTGLKKNTAPLDGIWLIDPDTDQDVNMMPSSDASWGSVNVPGQWQQQGLNIPWDKIAALERMFIIPSTWDGYRIFLRFDAIHGGTHCWLNDKPLGYSENLFTPVEWEITDAAKVGQPNRLNLKMKVDTASERLSYMGSDTRNLGGIDRSVKIFALPKLHISSLHLNAGLDRSYENGELKITLGFDNPDPTIADGFSVAVQLFDSNGKRVGHSNPIIILDPLKSGLNNVIIESQLINPLKWNAEQPNLYKLVLILKKDRHALEQIEYKIGFGPLRPGIASFM